MNVIFKASIIFILVLLGVIYRQSRPVGSIFEPLISYKRYSRQFLDFVESIRDNSLLRSRLRIVFSIVLLFSLVVIKLSLPGLFYYALPCLLFFILILNMDGIMRMRSNSDFIGEAAIGYLIFLSYVLFIILFIYLVTIYFKNSEEVFLF